MTHQLMFKKRMAQVSSKQHESLMELQRNPLRSGIATALICHWSRSWSVDKEIYLGFLTGWMSWCQSGYVGWWDGLTRGYRAGLNFSPVASSHRSWKNGGEDPRIWLMPHEQRSHILYTLETIAIVDVVHSLCSRGRVDQVFEGPGKSLYESIISLSPIPWQSEEHWGAGWCLLMRSCHGLSWS